MKRHLLIVLILLLGCKTKSPVSTDKDTDQPIEEIVEVEDSMPITFTDRFTLLPDTAFHMMGVMGNMPESTRREMLYNSKADEYELMEIDSSNKYIFFRGETSDNTCEYYEINNGRYGAFLFQVLAQNVQWDYYEFNPNTFSWSLRNNMIPEVELYDFCISCPESIPGDVLHTTSYVSLYLTPDHRLIYTFDAFHFGMYAQDDAPDLNIEEHMVEKIELVWENGAFKLEKE